MINVNALPIVDAFTSNGQPLVAILGPNHEVYWEAVKKMEGILPLIFESRKGGPLKEYKIYGNTPYQEWTPSPEKERTANLFCPPSPYGISIQTGEVDTKTERNHGDDFVEVRPNVTYHIKFDAITTSPTDCNFWIIGYDENKQIITDGTYNATYKSSLFNSTISKNATNHPFVTSPTTKYIRWYTTSIPTNWDEMSPMLNEGSTSLPYEPYGYREKTGPCEVKGVGEKTGNLCNVIIDVASTRKTTATKISIENNVFKVEKESNTATDTAFNIFSEIVHLNAGTYTLSFYIKTNISNYYIQSSAAKNTNWITGLRIESVNTFGTSSNIYIGSAEIGLWVRKSITVTVGDGDYRANIGTDAPNLSLGDYVLIKNIMLNSGTEALPYKPFGYETPVVSREKNLCPKITTENGWVKGFYYAYNSPALKPGDIAPQATPKEWASRRIALPYGCNGKKLLFSTNGFDVTEDKWMAFCYFDKDNNYISRPSYNKYSDVFSTIPDNARYVGISFRAYTNDETILQNIDIQLEITDIVTPYTPYRPPITTTIYHDNPYFTGDYIHKDKDGGVEHREWAIAEIKQNPTPTSGISIAHEFDNWSMFRIPLTKNVKYASYAYCSHLAFESFGNMDSGRSTGITTHPNSNIGLLYISVYGIKTIQEIVDWINSERNKGMPVTVYYQLATPTDTEKDLPDIVTASGYNSIDTDTQIKPEKMEIAYR